MVKLICKVRKYSSHKLSASFPIGIKIGRRSIDILLINFTGQVLEHFHTRYAFPKKEEVFSEIDRGLLLIGNDVSGIERLKITRCHPAQFPEQIVVPIVVVLA